MSDAMTRRDVLAGAGVSLSAAAQTPRKRPNVLFFFPDQLRVHEVGYNGGKNVPTPNIDRLARQGVVFNNAISSCPVCTPYRAMLQTGRWPTLSGGVMNWINLPSTGQSIADVFSKAGYDTGFMGNGIWRRVPGPELSRDQKPKKLEESEFVPPGPKRMGYQHWEAFNFHANFAKPFYYKDTSERLFMPGYETDSLTDFAMDYMGKRANSERPFFLMVAPHPPHPPWREDQTPAKSLAQTPKDLYWRPNVKGRNDSPKVDPRCYYAMIKNTDDNVGRLLDFMDKTGLAENTILVFTSDHGEMLASHSRYNKMVPYSEALDVPLIVRWPKHTKAGTKSDALYTPMDHFPTLARLCGLDVPEIVNGMDLSGHVLGRGGPERDAALIMNYVSHWDYPETMTLWPEWRGIRTKQHTYSRWINGAEEIYDNKEDEFQMRSMFNGRDVPQVMTRLRSRLKDMLNESHDEFIPGDRYATWFTLDRDLVRNALGPWKGA